MISDTLVQLQGLVKQNHLHHRTQTRKMVGLAAQQKDTEAVDWFFAQFSNPPYPDFAKNFLNEDLLKILVNSQWDYAWGKITDVLCTHTKSTSASLYHLLDIASPNPLAMQYILTAAIASLEHCPDPTQQKEMASAIAITAVRKNLPDVYNAVVKYASNDVLYKKSFYWDSVLASAVDVGSLWVMDVLAANHAPSKITSELLRHCAPLYSIEKVEHMYNTAKGAVSDGNALNVELIVALAQRFVEPQTALFLQTLISQTLIDETVHSNRSVLRWCACAMTAPSYATYQNVVDAITNASDMVKPLQIVLDNADWLEDFIPLIRYWSTNHTLKFIDALADVVATKKTTSKVARKLIGELGDQVDMVIVNNWAFNSCEEVSRIKLKWKLEHATASSGTSVKKKM